MTNQNLLSLSLTRDFRRSFSMLDSILWLTRQPVLSLKNTWCKSLLCLHMNLKCWISQSLPLRQLKKVLQSPNLRNKLKVKNSQNLLRPSQRQMLTSAASNTPRRQTSASGTRRLLQSLSWSNTTTFQDATSCVPPRSTFGNKSQALLMHSSSKKVSKMFTSLCSSLRLLLTKKKIMLLVSLPKSPGWQNPARVKCQSQSQSDPLLRQSCTPPTLNGSDPIEISLFCSTSGPMW